MVTLLLARQYIYSCYVPLGNSLKHVDNEIAKSVEETEAYSQQDHMYRADSGYILISLSR